MDRRNFVKQGLMSATAGMTVTQAMGNPSPLAEATFKLNFAPHEGTFKNSGGANFVDQIKFMYDMGFRAIEDNGMLKRSREEQDKIGSILAKLGMTMGVFVVDG